LQLNSSAEERETKTAISRQRPDRCKSTVSARMI